MKRVFADSFYFFALLNQKDQSHKAVVEWTKSFTGQLMTTEWVMLELADGLAYSPGRSSLHRTRQGILESPHHQLVSLEMQMYEEGLRLYSSRADKEWSLTDCLSFVVMEREGLVEALTGDQQFEQAGFVALFK